MRVIAVRTLLASLLIVAPVSGLQSVELLRPRSVPVARMSSVRMATVPPGGKVLFVGNGPVQLLAARIAALRGFEATIACVPQALDMASQLLWDDSHPEGSLPIKLLPIAGDDAVEEDIDRAVEEAEGLVIAFDGEQTIPDQALNVFMRPSGGTKLTHVSIMSRYLNGQGMGFVPMAAKAAANAEIWAGGDDAIAAYKSMEASVYSRAKEMGVTTTIVRAGTLKGGASGDVLGGGNGVADFLNPAFYKFGQQDVANWRLLYDVSALSVEISKGDTLPGPGFTAALTATTAEGGAGDSHRGAVATALVEALRVPSAAGGDYSLKSSKGKEFPAPEQWATLFDKAA